VASYRADQREAMGLPVKRPGASLVGNALECQGCHETFLATARIDAKWCSPGCRQAAYRAKAS